MFIFNYSKKSLGVVYISSKEKLLHLVKDMSEKESADVLKYIEQDYRETTDINIDLKEYCNDIISESGNIEISSVVKELTGMLPKDIDIESEKKDYLKYILEKHK